MSFHDEMAPLYHLIYPNWDDSVQRQGEKLTRIIKSEWPGHRKVSCGIVTQSFGLASRGYSVTGSDLSAGEIDRARDEAARRGVDIPFSVCDMRNANTHHGTGFSVLAQAFNPVKPGRACRVLPVPGPRARGPSVRVCCLLRAVAL